MRKILVLRGGALGDFIVTLPALALLRRRWPQARIELVGNATAAALGVHAGLLDAVSSQHDQLWGALHADRALPVALQERLGAFDLVVNYWPDPDGALRRHFPVRAKQVFLSAPALPTTSPAAAHYCAPLQELGLSTADYAPILARPDPQPGWIALHPGSGSPKKNWPPDRWADLAAWLKQECAARLFIISGEAESPGLLQEYGEPWRNVPLNELLKRLAQCRLFIGHDSGVSHVAAAAGAPCLLFFGPTDPARWAPPHAQVQVLRPGPAMNAITGPMAREAVSSILRDQK